MSENSRVHEFTVGLFGIGLDTYWPQFEGLQQRLTGYTQQLADRLEKTGARVINRFGGFSRKGRGGGPFVQEARCRSDLPVRHDLRFVVHRPSGCKTGESARDPPQSFALRGN